ncbi:hydroxymethylbilane synthase [Flaviaesturariibacter flavus]|uniref:Porphobilinogen deaminase n=1 Tax=Flaviaesturariibacter flavus TaxID=2502780 RepID=A0A4R1B6D0_9BACT|nr:hydroxymethylbilane synthase [Flaviaesturariibacter flavus]TCJ13220.1 hydroxymethylbilane synthase [Flaviaesturariibacter flavus]
MSRTLRIGTRDSQLAVWQATLVQNLLKGQGVSSELIYIKSEGDIDTVTPLYALGVQGVFTRSLDAALLSGRIDIAVHSMKDVPTQLAQGIQEVAVLERASTKDIFVYKNESDLAKLGWVNGQWSKVNREEQALTIDHSPFTIGTSSIRRIAQWKHRYPNTDVENLRGNVNTRLRKVAESDWAGAIFAAAGVERIEVRPATSVDLDWMLPAPAQGAIMIVCRSEDAEAYESVRPLNHPETALCVRVERDFLRTLMGGCSTPISALARIEYAQVRFEGNLCAPDGSELVEIQKQADIAFANNLGVDAANELLQNPRVLKIVEAIRNAKG